MRDKIRKKEYMKDYYQKTKDTYRKRQKDHLNQTYAWINELKVKLGCKDCGYNKNSIALQFDHLRDKVDSVSKLVASWATTEVLLQEIAKCEVVCANCHFIRTHERRLNKSCTI